MYGVIWTDKKANELMRLWAEGLSASEIAKRIGGVSRNAVIGKVHRMNLPGRSKAGGSSSAGRSIKAPKDRSTGPKSLPPSVDRGKMTKLIESTPLSTEEVPEEAEVRRSLNVVVPIARRLAITELSDVTCKWPIGDPLKEDFFFCGCESTDSAPYCTYHAKLAYQPVSERRRAAR